MSSVEKESPDGDRRGPLAMGSACHQCRKKKSVSRSLSALAPKAVDARYSTTAPRRLRQWFAVADGQKCDGVRPTCGPCANPFRRIAGDCTWDDKPFHGGRPKGRKSSTKRDTTLTAAGGHIYGDAFTGSRRRALGPPGSQSLTPEDGIALPLSGGGLLDYEMDFGMPYSMGSNGTEGLINGMERGWRVEDERMSGVTFSRASADLPSMDIVEHVCNVFFDKVPLAPLMMSRNRFMVDLHRAPNHRQRPTSALLHAILAITARYLPDSLLQSREYQPNASRYEGPLSSSDPAYSALSGTGRSYNPRGTALQRFETFHRDRATEKSWASIAEGYEDMIDSSRAATIVTQLDYFNADTVRFFPGVSVAIRCLIALHCNETSNIPASSWDRYSFRLMHPPRQPLDQAHRDRVWWVTWLMDKHTTFMGNWVPSIADYEVTVELPVSQEAYNQGEVLVGVQSLRSPDLFTHNPPIHQDGLCLMIKATLLHAQAGAYLRDYSRGPHSAPRYACQDQLWSLLGKIDQFYQIFPEQFKHPQLGVKLDRHVLAAIWMAHGAQAVLGEPIIAEAWTSDLAVSTLSAVRTGLKLLHEVMSSSFDLTLLHNVVCLVWYNFARVLSRFLDAALASGDLTSASVFSNEMQIVKDGLEAYATRHDYGRRMANRLEALMRARANAEEVGDAPLVWVEGTGAISDSERDLSVSISPASFGA